MRAKKSRFARPVESEVAVVPTVQQEDDDYLSSAYLAVEADAPEAEKTNQKQRSFKEMMATNRDAALAAPIDKSNKGFKVS
jgi:hypothetical protein